MTYAACMIYMRLSCALGSPMVTQGPVMSSPFEQIVWCGTVRCGEV